MKINEYVATIIKYVNKNLKSVIIKVVVMRSSAFKMILKIYFPFYKIIMIK